MKQKNIQEKQRKQYKLPENKEPNATFSLIEFFMKNDSKNLLVTNRKNVDVTFKYPLDIYYYVVDAGIIFVFKRNGV